MRQPYSGLAVVTGLRKWPGLGAVWGNHPKVSQLLSESRCSRFLLTAPQLRDPNAWSPMEFQSWSQDLVPLTCPLGHLYMETLEHQSPPPLTCSQSGEGPRAEGSCGRNRETAGQQRARARIHVYPHLTSRSPPRSCGQTTGQHGPTPGRIAPDLQDVPGQSLCLTQQQ